MYDDDDGFNYSKLLLRPIFHECLNARLTDFERQIKAYSTNASTLTISILLYWHVYIAPLYIRDINVHYLFVHWKLTRMNMHNHM